MRVVLDGAPATLMIEPPLADGVIEAWTFASMRAQASPRQLAFASADQPVAALELAAQRERIRVRRDGSTLRIAANGADVGLDWSEIRPDADGRVRIVAHRADAAEPDVGALMASSIARARRRAAERLRVALPGATGDVVAGLERDIWLEASARTGLDDRARIAMVLALLALNDARGALEVIRAGADAVARDAALSVIAAGAWAAWRGTMLPVDAVREVVTESAAGSSSPGGDALGRSAAALRPFLADQTQAGSGGAAKSAQEPGAGFLEVARMPDVPSGCARLIELVHGTLGVVPDAARARVRLGPRLSPGRSVVEQLVVGDAAIEMVAEVTEDSAAIEVEQTSGGTPFTGILEPRIPARRLRSAFVEATPADLESAADDDGLRARVQIVIDRRRRLVLHFERR